MILAATVAFLAPAEPLRPKIVVLLAGDSAPAISAALATLARPDRARGGSALIRPLPSNYSPPPRDRTSSRPETGLGVAGIDAQGDQEGAGGLGVTLQGAETCLFPRTGWPRRA